MDAKLSMPVVPRVASDWRSKIATQRSFLPLRERGAFEHTYRRHTYRRHTPYFVCFYRKDTLYRVGVVASKKVGKATKRNRAKRRLREAFRRFGMQLHPGIYIWVAKPEIVNVAYDEILRQMDLTLRKGSLLATKHHHTQQEN